MSETERANEFFQEHYALLESVARLYFDLIDAGKIEEVTMLTRAISQIVKEIQNHIRFKLGFVRVDKGQAH